VVAELDAGVRVGMLRPAPAGRWLVTVPAAESSGAPVLWDLDVAAQIARLDPHGGRVFGARWISDRLLTFGGDGAVRMWDAAGQLLQTYSGSPRYLADAAVDPSGTLLVAGGGDGRLRFWDLVSGHALWNTEAHKSGVVGLHFDGGAIVTRGFDGSLSRWVLPIDRTVVEAAVRRGIVRAP
jgi:WD40 repeat protein